MIGVIREVNAMIISILKSLVLLLSKPMLKLGPRMKISVNTDISVILFYGYIENIKNIDEYFDKNIDKT